MQKEVFEYVMDKEITNYLKCKLILSYGFDSSTCQSLFKQAFNEPSTSNHFDASLLATTIITLRHLVTSGQSIWKIGNKRIYFDGKIRLEKRNWPFKSMHITIDQRKENCGSVCLFEKIKLLLWTWMDYY